MTRPPGDPAPDNGVPGQPSSEQPPFGQPSSDQTLGPPPSADQPSADQPSAGHVASGQPVPAGSGLDAWGRPLLNFDPAANRVVLTRAAARLQTWLGVLLAALLLGAVASALLIFVGGQAGLSALKSLSSDVTIPGYATGLLALAALLTVVWVGVYVGLVAWARELLRRLATWALTTPQTVAPDAVRTEQLRRTLAGWLTFGQWGTLAGAVFGTALLPVSLALAQRLTEQYAPGGTSEFSSFGPGLAAVQIVSSLLSVLPGVVIVWLILGAIKRFMNLAVNRARGLATGPVMSSAKVIGNWLLMSMILLGLSLVNLLGAGVLVLVLGGFGLSQLAVLDPTSPLSSALVGWLIGLLAFLLVFVTLIYALFFGLLAISRSYALSLARLLDLDTRTVPGLPVLPTGSAGEHPNVYTGYR